MGKATASNEAEQRKPYENKLVLARKGADVRAFPTVYQQLPVDKKAVVERDVDSLNTDELVHLSEEVAAATLAERTVWNKCQCRCQRRKTIARNIADCKRVIK